jgi:hypothetical protein
LETLPGDELFEVDSAAHDSPLKAVRERLKAIERCPRSEDLPLAVLASIESMYEDFKQADDDDERVEVMREAFPNETFLRIGVLSLIDLLDPSINIEDPTIRTAEIDALIKIVLFEERKRRPGSRPPSLPPPPPPTDTRKARSLAPPPRKKSQAPQAPDGETEIEVF